MPEYLALFSYAPDAWDRMVDEPGDRADAARRLIEEMGGTMTDFSWMLGDHDGYVSLSGVPDAETAAGVVAGVQASGLIKRLTTYQLVGRENIAGVLAQASRARSAYAPPGTPADWREGYDALGN